LGVTAATGGLFGIAHKFHFTSPHSFDSLTFSSLTSFFPHSHTDNHDVYSLETFNLDARNNGWQQQHQQQYQQQEQQEQEQNQEQEQAEQQEQQEQPYQEEQQQYQQEEQQPVQQPFEVLTHWSYDALCVLGTAALNCLQFRI
jgi:hypothetical protein